MTTRRRFLGVAGGLAGGVLLGGCGARSRPVVAVPDSLLVDTATGLALVSGLGVKALGVALPTRAGTAVYTAHATGTDTVLASVATPSGTVTGQTLLAGQWVPRVASPSGSRVALTAPGDPSPYQPEGRDRSTILIVETGGGQHRLDLPGNCVPDAFTVDGTALFVLEWLPPRAPDRYRVRLVELRTGTFTGMLTRDKQPVPPGTEEQMRALGRLAVPDPAGNLLYTLYTPKPGGPLSGGAGGAGAAPEWSTESGAFVHVLDTQVGWAYCLDLPDPFGMGPAAAHTIAVTPDGRRLLVANLTSGHLAVADTETLTVREVVKVPTGGGTAYAVAPSSSERLYLGVGAAVVVVDLGLLKVVAQWDAGGSVAGLAVSRDGARLLVGYRDAVGWFGIANGKLLGRAPIPGLTELRRTV